MQAVIIDIRVTVRRRLFRLEFPTNGKLQNTLVNRPFLVQAFCEASAQAEGKFFRFRQESDPQTGASFTTHTKSQPSLKLTAETFKSTLIKVQI